MSKDSVRHAIRNVRTAKTKLHNEVVKTFPIGGMIDWNKGGHHQYGNVVAHGSSGDVRVHNERTDKQYWITMYDVLGYVT